jgi:hypothetical protein
LQHAVAVAEHLDAVVAVEAAAFGIGNAFVRRQRSLLGARRQLDAALGVQLSRVEQIEIRRLERQQIFLRRAGAGIFRGVARDVQRRLYGAGDGVRTEIGGRGAATFSTSPKRVLTLMPVDLVTATSAASEPARASSSA